MPSGPPSRAHRSTVGRGIGHRIIPTGPTAASQSRLRLLQRLRPRVITKAGGARFFNGAQLREVGKALVQTRNVRRLCRDGGLREGGGSNKADSGGPTASTRRCESPLARKGTVTLQTSHQPVPKTAFWGLNRSHLLLRPAAQPLSKTPPSECTEGRRLHDTRGAGRGGVHGIVALVRMAQAHS